MSSLAIISKTVRQNFLVRLYKHYIIDSVLIAKKHGFKELIRQRGIKFLIAVISYYLVRDTLLYIVIPLCVAKGIL
ncbi:hypothetical protein MJD09_25895 [bacterium]|nr:hypothetical protein [bacterium]